MWCIYEEVALRLDSNQKRETGTIMNLEAAIPLSGSTELGEEQWGRLDEREGVTICLGLRNNQITEISRLVENEGLTRGEGIELRGNPLGEESLNTYIPQIEERVGVLLP